MIDFLTNLVSSVDVTSLILTVFGAIATYLIIPIATKIKEYLDSKNLDKYTRMLVEAVEVTVKDLYQTMVEDLKGTDEWTEEAKENVRSIAQTKIKMALTTVAYKSLTEANEDFIGWVDTLIESELYNLKRNYYS